MLAVAFVKSGSLNRFLLFCVFSSSVQIVIACIGMHWLFVGDAPYPPAGLVARLVDSRTIILQWEEPPLHNGYPIVAYSVHYHSARSGELQKVVRNTSIVLTQLTPFTNYTFFVKAYNSRSFSGPSDQVSLFTGDDGMLALLSNLSIVTDSNLPTVGKII